MTPAEIRKDRKTAVRSVKKALRDLDTTGEKLERRLAQILRIKKDFPDADHAIMILEELRKMDKELDVCIEQAQAFQQLVQVF
jgi:hypothetical protein